MVSNTPYHPGVSGKSLSSLGAGTTQSPHVNAPLLGVEANEVADIGDLIQSLIQSTEARNEMIRKINSTKARNRLDPDFVELVSDDEPEVDLPNVSRMLGRIRQRPELPINSIQPTSPGNNMMPTSGLGTTDPIAAGGSVNVDNSLNASSSQATSLSNIDYRNLAPIYCYDDVSKNKQQLDIMKLPNSILQMAFFKFYIPLSMLTTSALTKIRANDGLKYHKIPYGNGVGKQSLDESIFPAENTLSELLFLQAYHNWLSVLDIVAMPEVAVGWYEHHLQMLHDQKILASFEAWRSMDKQLCTQFIEDPFVVDPSCNMYTQLFECARMDVFLAHTERSFQGGNPHSFRGGYSSRGGRNDSSTSQGSASRYIPYDKDIERHRHDDSFQEPKRPTLCLRCGTISHRAGVCVTTQSNRTEHPIISEWKQNRLMSRFGQSHLYHLQFPGNMC